MEVNDTELEEGEASCYYKDDDENFDPDVDLAYLEEKLDQVLGHFQKDFEGGAFAENLGAKYGGYGSFLPTYERSPPVLSTPKTPQGNCNTSKSLMEEGASQNLKASSSALPIVRLGTASSSARLSHNSRVLGGVSVKEGSCVPSTQVAERCSLKDETSNRSGNSADQRTLKVRIKMNSDNTAQKNVAIYSGLGLNSPSSSFGNSPEESGEMPPPSQLTVDESPPTNIIQVMTSFPVPGDVLMSPLHDSLICLTRKKKLYQQKMLPPSKGHQERSSLSVEEPASTQGNGKLLKEPKIEVKGKSEKQVELKIENLMNIKNDMKILIKKKSETDTLGDKELLSNGYKALHLSNSGGDVSGCVIGRTHKVSQVTNENEVKGRLSLSELAKEESLELISGHDCDKNKKQNSRCGSVETVWKQSVKKSDKDSPGDIRDEGKSKGYKFFASIDYSGASKCKEELDLHTQNACEESTYPDQEKTNVPGKKEKLSFEGKIKSKGTPNNEKQPGILTKESLGGEMGVVPKDKLNGGYGVSLSSRKVQKLKSQKDTVRDNRRDSLGGKVLEPRDKMDVAERLTDDIEVEWKSSKDKPSEKQTFKKVDIRLISGGSVKDAPTKCRPTMENGLASEIVPAAAASFVIEEDWVCCDSCQKWRLLPFGNKPEQLPEKWLCSMLDWLGPGMNRCDISEEETTKALNALYQLPSSESLTNRQTHTNRTSSVVPLGHAQHLDPNYQNLSSNGMSSRGKKKHGVKETPIAGSGNGLLNSYLQEPAKCTSLNDMNQPTLVSNPMKKSSGQLMIKLQNLGMEEKRKEKQMIGGDGKKVRLKHKKDTDHYTCGTSKKPKRAYMLHADKDQNSDIDLGRVGLTSSNGVLTHALGQDGKYNEFCYSEDTKDKVQMSAKKPGLQTQVSLDGGPLDVRTCNKGDSSMKKKRMREWQDNQNNVETFQNCVHEGRVYTKEESSESGSRKDKKARILKTDGKESSTSNVDDKSNRKSRVTKIVVSGTKAHSIDAMKKDRTIVKEQPPKIHSKRNAFQQTLEDANALKRDLGSGHVSLAATSSSSKISGSRKIRGNFEEVKSSPVESVSSSPFRTSNSDRLTSARGDGFGKDDAVCGGFSLTSNSKRCWDGDGNGNVDRLWTSRMEKTSDCSHPESHKFSTVGYHKGDANGEFSVKCKPSLVSKTTTMDLHHSHDGNRENKNHPEDAVFLKKSGETCLQSKDNIRGSTYDLDRHNMKILNPANEYFKKSQRYMSEIDHNHNVRNNLPEECGIKPVKVRDEKSRGDNTGQGSSDSAVETQLIRKDCDVSDEKLGATQIPIRKDAALQNMNQDSECGQKQNYSKSGKSILCSNSHSELKGGIRKEEEEDDERKEGARSHGSRAVAGSEREAVFQGLSVGSTINGNVPKSLKQSGTATNKNGVNRNMGHLKADHQRARDVSVSSPVISSSSQSATKTLNQAKNSRDYAELLKKSEFDMESNVAYFKAALEFLQGAALLESCSSEKGKHGDMTPLQVYSTTAKLCESCANEYEKHKEVASAALAYKCMEVAYMRVVYCKHSSTTRDWQELQATLNMPTQGESPSSSASDIDNLNNQVTAEKSILPKGAGSHVAGNHVAVARNRSNFVRLLDFTQDVNCAMEASRKSQSAFSAACLAVEDAHKNDCISSIRRVIDFSFHDVEELVRLVELAIKAIGRSKLGDARD